MKKRCFAILLISVVLFSCNNRTDKGKFTLTGELKAAGDQKVYLEELFFSEKQPEVLDTGEIKNGIFSVSAIAPEEGLYRLRTEDGKHTFLFISKPGKIDFSADINKPGNTELFISGAANSSLKKLLVHTDSIGSILSNKNRLLSEFIKAGVLETDSTFISISNEYNSLSENFGTYCFTFADTAKSPIVSLFAATMAPVELSKFEKPLAKLVGRFPDHTGIAAAMAYIKSQPVPETQTQQQPKATAAIGDMAPELTMNDVDGNPFSLSQLKGKFVLVDFWASWCGPCRDENPNVVAAFNQFKDKNFTVLGVSLDKDKAAWLAAIKDDNLNWPQISDLKYWNSAAVGLFGFNGIPYNVLLDPQGKIIATGLRENALQNKLAEVLK